MTDQELLALGQDVLRTEAEALRLNSEKLGPSFLAAVKLLKQSSGKIVVTGMGKSGLVARKIASTMTSTGTFSVFIHPAEALHGDLGTLQPADILLALSKGGESEEILQIIPAIKKIGVKIIALTSEARSELAQQADVVLLAHVEKEACPHGLAPTASSTAAMALGDALAVTLMKLKGFEAKDFARYHPGGRLGRQLLLSVADLMIPRARLKCLHPDRCDMEEVLGAAYEYGIVLFSRDEKTLAGILTDGDIRRLLKDRKASLWDVKVNEVMNTKALSVAKETQAIEALRLMEERDRPLNVLPVVGHGELQGLLRLHELVKIR